MKQVVFIHGGSAYSSYDAFLEYLQTVEVRNPAEERPIRWGDTLRRELGDGFEVFTPAMPNKQNAKYREWKLWFERHFEFLRDGVVLVGWSQGGYFLTKYLIENETPFAVGALFLVAAPFEPDAFGGEDGGDFNFDTERAGELAQKVSHVCIAHSEDDFIVPFAHAEKYRSALPSAEFVTFTDRGHFLQPKFPELIKNIQAAAAVEDPDSDDMHGG